MKNSQSKKQSEDVADQVLEFEAQIAKQQAWEGYTELVMEFYKESTNCPNKLNLDLIELDSEAVMGMEEFANYADVSLTLARIKAMKYFKLRLSLINQFDKDEVVAMSSVTGT